MQNNGTLKDKLHAMREGEVLAISSKDLANYYCGGKIPIPAHNHASPYHLRTKSEKAVLLRRAYRELILTLRLPPEGFEAEEMPGSVFRIQFIRMERSK